MSGKAPDDGEEEKPAGKEPRKPWQYIALIALAVLAFGCAYLFMRNADFWRPAPPQASDPVADNKRPSYQPAKIEKVAASTHFPVEPPRQQVAETRHTAPSEEAAFNAPLVGPEWKPIGQQQQRARPVAAASRQEAGTASSGSLLRKTATAYRLPHPEFTITRGQIIPCTQVTVLDTGTGGNVLISAEIPKDVWGYGNKIKLIDRGTQVIGEVGHGLVNGLDRIGVVWRELTTPYPSAVRITVDSPAAGPLGEGGLDGEVNRHEWQKIKGVVMLSLLEGFIDTTTSALTALASSGRNNNYINFGSFGSRANRGGQEAAGMLLQSTLQIPDTIHRNQGSACSIYLAGNLDFYSVYGVESIDDNRR